MIVIVGGIKGGSGKSTIATNLAVLRSKDFKTLLIDADDQKSTTDWAEQRESYFKGKKQKEQNLETLTIQGAKVYDHIQKNRKKYDDIIIDVGGRDTASQRAALSIADIFIIPFRPRSFDVWTLGQVRKLYEEARGINSKLKACVVINQADPRGLDNNTACEIITEIPHFQGNISIITYRKAFANAAADGLAVTERGTDQKAKEEILNLYHSIYD